MLVWADRVAELSTSTGTGDFTLAGALTSYVTFASVCSTGDMVYYLIVALDGSGLPSGAWETGLGTYSAANTLTRTLVLASSNAGAAVSFAAGAKRVVLTQAAAQISPDIGAPVLRPVTADFTLENAGTATASNGASGMVLDVPSASVNVRFLRYTAGLPGASWSLTTRARVLGPNNAVVHNRCIIARNSTNGRLVSFGDSSNLDVGCARWSSYTAFTSTGFSYDAYSSEIPWRRVVCDSATMTYEASHDGLDWTLVGTESVAAYLTAAGGGSLDQIGVGLILGAAPTVAQKNIFQHFELV